MAIRFRVPAEAVERVAHAYSPLLEAVLSLHVLVEPKHHPLQHPWVRRMRTLPADLKRDVAAFSFAYRQQIPDLLAPSPEQELRSFEDELAALRSLDADTVALEFMRPLYDTAGQRDTALLEREEVRRHIVTAARSFGGDPDLARLIYEHPARLRDEFADLVERYWESRVRRGVGAAGAHACRRGLGGRAPHRRRRALRVSPQRLAPAPGRPGARGVRYRRPASAHRRGDGEAAPRAERVCLASRARQLRRAVAAERHLRRAFRDRRLPPAGAVGRPGRRATGSRGPDPAPGLKLISERPRSTQELAPLVGISEAGLSKHLRQLATAGLVESRREGYYVLYSVVPERIDALSDGVRRFMDE